MTTRHITDRGPGISRVWWAVYDSLKDELSKEVAAWLAWEVCANLRNRDLLKAQAWKPESA